MTGTAAAFGFSPRLELGQRTRLSPAAVAMLSLLALPRHDVEDLVRVRVAANPALAAGPPRRCPWCTAPLRARWCAACAGAHTHLTVERSAAEDPRARLRLDARAAVPRGLTQAVDAVVDHLDRRGLLDGPVEEIARDAGLPVEQVSAALGAVMDAGPPGVGARDARECLAVQARWHAGKGGPALLVRIVPDHLEAVARGEHAAVAAALDVPVAAVDEAVRYLRARLRPYPVFTGPDPQVARVPPDVVVHADPQSPGALNVIVLGSADAGLRIDAEVARAAAAADAGTRDWFAAHLAEARTLLADLDRRAAALQRVAAAAVAAQYEFVLRGPEHHVPLTRTAVAQTLDLHPSTVSRAVAAKTVRLPDGRTEPLAAFFAPAVGVKSVLGDLLADDPGATDAELTARLSELGHSLARRTVNKYRRALAVPQI